MKISYVTMQFPVPSETFASLDVEVIKDKGHDVKVYCLRPKHKSYRFMVESRNLSDIKIESTSLLSFFKALAFSASSFNVAIYLFLWVLKCCWKSPKHLLKSLILFFPAIYIFRSIQKDNPDVVHLFWGHYPSMVGCLVKKYMPKTVCTIFLGAHDLVTKYPGTKEFAKKVDAIFTHTKSNLQMINDFGIKHKDINVVFRGTKLDLNRHCELKLKDASDLSFLTASRLIKDKGVDTVIDIFNEVLYDYPSATLIIAGEGPYRKALQDMVNNYGIHDSVSFVGHINQEELKSLMFNTDFFLLMSRYASERLPNVVKEAMFQKCLVITTETVGINELIDHEKDGYILSEKEEVKRAVINCVKDPELREYISSNAKSKIIQYFDVEITMDCYLSVWADKNNGVV